MAEDPGTFEVEHGYPGASLPARLLLVFTHLMMVRTLCRAWRVREAIPWLFISLLGCYVASSSYHACYSFDVCVFTQREMHRHADHHWSLMLAAIQPLIFRWHVRRIDARAARAVRPTARRFVVTVAATGPPRGAVSAPLGERGSPAAPAPRHLLYTYPLNYDRLILVLHALGIYLHVRMGLYRYSNMTTLVVAWGVTAVSVAVDALMHGLRLRMSILLKVALLTAAGYGVFMVDRVLGAMGHNMWHVLAFGAIDLYVGEGPLSTGRDGLHVTLRTRARPAGRR